MSELQIKVGKKYKCRNGKIAIIHNHWEGDFYCFGGSIDGKYNGWSHNGKPHSACINNNDDEHDLISEHTEEPEYLKPEELVPGEKYAISNKCHAPYTFINDAERFGHTYTGAHLIFIDNAGIMQLFFLDEIKGKITKHIPKPAVETTKIITKFTTYDSEDTPYAGLVDELTGLNTTDYLYGTYLEAKNELGGCYNKIARVKIITEVEPDYTE